MSRTKKIKTYDYGNVLVSTQQNCSYCVGNALQLADDAPKPSIINLGSKFDEIDALSPCPVAYMNAVAEDQNLDYDYTTAFNNLNQYIYWIWGGISNGGLGIFKHSSGDVCFICSHGYYIKNNNTKGKYYLEYFYRMSNYSSRSNDYKIKQVAFLYYNQAQANTNLVNPFPTDNYAQYVQVLTNLWYYGNTSNPYGWHFWNRKGSNNVTDWFYYDPQPNNSSWFETNDLNSLFVVGGWSYGINIPRNIRAYYPPRVWSTSGNPYYQNTPNIYDDEHWELSGYQHQYGHWYGELADEDEDDQGDDGDGDNIQVPPAVPTLDDLNGDATDTGFVRIYKPTTAELRGLANYMFSSITDADATQLKKLLSNPLDYIIGLNMCHFTPAVGEYEEDVKLGGLSIGEGLGMFPVAHQYVTISGGSITLVGQKGNYLDYSPFTKIQIFIPYTGMHDLPTDLVQNSTLTLTYIIDLLSGALVAHLSITKDPQFNGEADATDNALVYTYTGNCFTPIPIANADYRGAINGMLGLCGGAISSAVSGNPMALFKAGTSAIMNAKPTVQSKASVANDFGFMSGQIAYLIISRPIESKPSKYYEWVGHMCNRIEPVSYYAGGVLTIKEDSLWTSFNNTNITDTEAQEIRDLFKLGVYV